MAAPLAKLMQDTRNARDFEAVADADRHGERGAGR
jgi:hypothetical protein